METTTMDLTTRPPMPDVVPLLPLGADIALVGCGGIGARILPTLVKMVAPALEAQGLGHLRVNGTEPAKTNIYLIDPDEVVERNTWRQPFIKADVGKAKVEVLARRYGMPPYVNLLPRQLKVEECEDVFPNVRVVIGAVDGAAPRRFIHEQCQRNQRGGLLWIDAGNEKDHGQVIVEGVVWNKNRAPNRVQGLSAFPSLFEDDAIVEEPCGLRLDTQTPVTNNMAATIVLNYLHTVLTGGTLSSVGCRFSIEGGIQEVRGYMDYMPQIPTFSPTAP